MDLQKIGIKLYATGGPTAPLHDVVPVFHRWIQQSALGGKLIDVVDYRHVHRGPGVMLIGFDFHLAIDEEGGERGLSVDWKRPLTGQPASRIEQVLSVALDAAIALEDAPLSGTPISFDGRHLEIRTSERILAPNDDTTWIEFRGAIERVTNVAFPACRFEVERHPDPRRRLAARLSTTPGFSLREARSRLSPVAR